MRSILLLPLVARCTETIDVCIWCMFDFMSVVVIVKDRIFSLVVLKYIVCLCKGCDGCCVFLFVL